MSESPTERPRTPSHAATTTRRTGITVVIVLAVLTLLFFTVRYMLYAHGHESTDDAQVDADIVVVTSKLAERVATIDVATNTLVKRGQILMRLDDRDERRRYDAAVANLHAIEATATAANQGVSLTNDQQRAQIEQSNGAVAQANATTASAVAQLRQAESEVAVAESGVVTAEAQLHAAESIVNGLHQTTLRAQADFERSLRLQRTGDASNAEVDTGRAAEATAASNEEQAEANVGVAAANLRAAMQKVQAQRDAAAAAQANVEAQRAAIQTAQGHYAEAASPFRLSTQRSNAASSVAQVVSAVAALRQAHDALNDTIIRSPIDGYVGQKSVELGAMLAPGQQVMTLIPLHTYITANYKETQLALMHPGQRVDITVDTYPGHDFSGYVATLPPASETTYSLIPAQNASGNFVKVTQRLPVRIEVDQGLDREHPLRVGMSVETAVHIR